MGGIKTIKYGLVGLLIAASTGWAPTSHALENSSIDACLATSEAQCLLRAPLRSLEMHVQSGELLAFLRADESDRAPSVVVHVPQDLSLQIESGELTEEEAQVVSTELGALDGASYSLVSVDMLKADLGLPLELSLVEGDLHELILAHMQITLGIGHLSAAYLADQLGIETLSPSENLEEL